ncbi:uncharacterized protein LOC114521591 [Dendronephthya gigantea]|uniref:uncharacterized protein LOC114521591 n=1 Tax=Dendronephthya gigantea TaxID=151771 RepID=UPI00106A93E5|nr:uncharacterized protein LOC114521591 [Dendronephthya gigantea]
MTKNSFTSFLSVVAVFCLQDLVNAEYCPDNVIAGECFRERIVPYAIGATTVGFVFGIFLLVLSLCLFCKTKVKSGAIDWVHSKEPIDWVRRVQDLGTENNGHQFEPRKQGLGDDKPPPAMPRHFVSDRSLYSERGATSAYPSSNASDIVSAMDEIEDEEYRSPTGYFWDTSGGTGAIVGRTPGSNYNGDHPPVTSFGGATRHPPAPDTFVGRDLALFEKEKGSEYAETTSSQQNVRSAQILHHKKNMENPSRRSSYR